MVKFKSAVVALLAASAIASASDSGVYSFRAQRSLDNGKFAKGYNQLERALLASRKESDLLSESRVLIAMAQIRTMSLDLNFADSLLSIVRSDVKGSLHGEIALDAPEGIRLSDNTVSWAVEVSRYVELEAELPVIGRNVPAGSVFSIYPSKARVVFRCVFPVISDPSSTAVCYVDYKEFAGSLTGRCIIHCDNLPGGVISWSALPEVAECVEKL